MKKQQKNQYYLERAKNISPKDLTYLEKCKEVKIFSNKEVTQILDFILKAVQLDVGSLKEQKGILYFINYSITVRLK